MQFALILLSAALAISLRAAHAQARTK